MTDLRQAAQMALEALEGWEHCEDWVWPVSALEQAMRNTTESLAALRTALEQQAEPVAYLCENAVGHKYFRWKKPSSTYKPIALYTAPPQRQWVGLTDEEMSDTVADMDVDFGDLLWKVVCLTKIIEAKLKERNT